MAVGSIYSGNNNSIVDLMVNNTSEHKNATNYLKDLNDSWKNATKDNKTALFKTTSNNPTHYPSIAPTKDMKSDLAVEKVCLLTATLAACFVYFCCSKNKEN